MAAFDVLARNNSHLIRLTGLTGPNSSTIDNSTGVTAIVYADGAAVTGGGSTWPIVLTATSSAANDYEAQFSSTGFVLVNYQTCTCVASVDLGNGTVGEFERPLRFQVRSV